MTVCLCGAKSPDQVDDHIVGRSAFLLILAGNILLFLVKVSWVVNRDDREDAPADSRQSKPQLNFR